MVLQHEHTWSLIDLNPKYPHDEVVYDDEEDLIIKQGFECSCDLCNQVITFLHKYYYKCDQCDYSLHKLCAELPKTLEHASHNKHTLALIQDKACNAKFFHGANCWNYKCDKCRYYVHLDCAYLTDVVLTSNECEDDPTCLHLPLSDHNYNMIKDVVFKETNETSITHNSHEHPLLLVDTLPMNFNHIECNACLIPIVKNATFYKCTYGCNFFLHDWCTRLPAELKDYKGHPQHTLLLLPKGGHEFTCHVCNIVRKGFAYSCVECGYDIDVICAFIETIRHKYDKHPMTLCYTPVENHEGDYFCEVCEKLFNPYASFYHCHECDQSLHPECAPLMAQAKAYIHAALRVPNPRMDFIVTRIRE
ncbi:hypothetical protein E3N88_43012 [Mikania micrantha]|uniref:DC1 domain-containing protein n=1 Tax=Mikania micrantha TaxID=192012 RepID=A0A5N6LG80_9ASTR|nr:hypothetical protein E3N88_43012 [Mikania micrantha]